MKLSQQTKNTTELIIRDVHCYLMRTHGITAPKSAWKSLRQQLHNEFHARERECIRRTLEAKANELGYTLTKVVK